MNTTSTDTATPTRATNKGHGRPTFGMYYGNGPKPTTGRLGVVSGNQSAVYIHHADGSRTRAGGVAGKFWFAPVDLDQMHAEALAEDAARTAAQPAPELTGPPADADMAASMWAMIDEADRVMQAAFAERAAGSCAATGRSASACNDQSHAECAIGQREGEALDRAWAGRLI